MLCDFGRWIQAEAEVLAVLFERLFWQNKPSCLPDVFKT
jgi:hypothetical protein